MKVFLKKLIFFSVWLLIVSFIIQQIIFFSIRQINVGELGVINNVINGRINAEIIICGASRGYDAFDTRVMDKILGQKCYNISLTGSRLGLQFPILKTYFENNNKPKLIVLEVGMYSLFFDTRIYAPYKYVAYLNNKTIYDGLLAIDNSFVLQKYIPFTTFYYLNTDFQKRFIKELTYSFIYKKDYLFDGFNPMPLNIGFNNDFILDFEKNNYILYKIDDKAIVYLKEIIALCKSKNIPIILVNTPEYYRIQPIYHNRDKINNVIKNICNESDIHYLDYNETDLINEKHLFYDFTHLNYKGAQRFSEVFANDLMKYYNIHLK